jgi:hypothetical protein
MKPFHRLYSNTTTPKPATLRARPFLFISSFILLHQAIASGSLIPTYAFFANTDSSTALLAGPTAALVLRQKLPWPLARGEDERTVADALEDSVRAGVKGGFGLFRQWREGRKASQEDASGEGEAGVARGWRTRVTEFRAKPVGEQDDTLGKDVTAGLEGRQEWKGRLGDAASAVRMKHVMDFAAAYLVVKVCLDFSAFLWTDIDYIIIWCISRLCSRSD